MDTIQLSIKVIGLCLYVPDAAMEVLLPATPLDKKAPHCRAVEQHVAVLRLVAGSLAKTVPEWDAGNRWLSLDGRWLRFPALGDALRPALPADLVHLKEPLWGDVLDAKGAGRLNARVTLQSGGFTHHASGDCWEWKKGEIRRMTHALEWTVVEIPGKSLTAELSRTDGSDPHPVELLPDANDEIGLELWHVPPSDLPGHAGHQHAARDGEEALHFGAYYSLVSTPSCHIPVYRAHACPEVKRADDDYFKASGSAVSCMSAQK